MPKKKKTTARDLNDAVDLALAWLSDRDVGSIIEFADIHIKEIAHYEPKHPLIGTIKSIKLAAEAISSKIHDVNKRYSASDWLCQRCQTVNAPDNDACLSCGATDPISASEIGRD